ncbi:MAG: ABC transporter permease [Dehalococcoidia bacterium]|nr:ABC transporter permease [Dehalococcoidia bacterium]
MSASQAHVAEEQALRPLHRRGLPIMALVRFAQRKPLGALGALLLLMMVFIAVAAPVISPYDPIDVFADKRFTPPGREFLLGTDHVGRDILSRIFYGAQVSLYVGVLSVAIGTTAGCITGLISGYFGKHVDAIIQRAVDTIMAFPILVLALLVVTVLGSSAENVVIAVSVVLFPQGARVVRSAVLAVKGSEYVTAARAVGATDTRIMFLHILPQCVAPYIVLATAQLGWAIVVEATLSFLGVGTPPPWPSWGNMLSGLARTYIEQTPWLAVFPGVALSLSVFGVNLLGDALRDVLDPRLKRA